VLTKRSNENMYWEGSGSICSCLNSGRHVSCLPVFVKSSYYPFLNFENVSTEMRIAPKNNTV